VFVGLLAEQPVAQAADGQVADRGEGLASWLSMISRVTSSSS
jgi:hypothetical protein